MPYIPPALIMFALILGLALAATAIILNVSKSKSPKETPTEDWRPAPIKVLKNGLIWRSTTTCSMCQSELAFRDDHVQVKSYGLESFDYYIVCPVCNQNIRVGTSAPDDDRIPRLIKEKIRNRTK